jgi:hypothetical protein
MEWQPIETAPKDGTCFIAFTPKGVCRCMWAAVDWGDHPLDPTVYWWADPDGNLLFEDGPHDAPTHWMPFEIPE